MAGHNNWSKINRTQGAPDVKRGKIFSRLSKETTVPGRLGGGNPAFHSGLRAAISRLGIRPVRHPEPTDTLL